MGFAPADTACERSKPSKVAGEQDSFHVGVERPAQNGTQSIGDAVTATCKSPSWRKRSSFGEDIGEAARMRVMETQSVSAHPRSSPDVVEGPSRDLRRGPVRCWRSVGFVSTTQKLVSIKISLRGGFSGASLCHQRLPDSHDRAHRVVTPHTLAYASISADVHRAVSCGEFREDLQDDFEVQ